jgi:hypothetical protein
MEEGMNLLRSIALFLAVAAVSFSGTLAYSQQEVDPDHFDGSSAPAQKAAPVHHHSKRAHATMAKKASAKHHRAHASA